MKVIFVVPKQNHQLDTAKALSAGFKRHGITDIKLVKVYDPRVMGADLVAIWAWRPKRKGSQWWLVDESQKYRGGHSLVMERAYVGERHTWTSLGYDGLNGRADFCNAHITDTTRFNKNFSHLLQPWQDTDKRQKVVIAGQCRMDAAVSHINIDEWYRSVAMELNLRGFEVVFRPHPLNTHPWEIEPGLKVTVDTSSSFEECIKDAKCVVTYNSNAGVLSTLAGIPTISYDKGSMVHHITTHNLTNLSHKPDRREWSAKIAYSQWLPHEMSSGETWEHLKQKYQK
jgi:hypothetical protein